MAGNRQHQSDPRQPQESRTRAVPQLPIGVMALIVLGYCAITLGFIAENYPDGRHILSGLGLLLAVTGLQARQCYRTMTEGNSGWEPRASLAAQIALTYVPFLAFSDAWLAMPGLLAGSALSVLPATWRWIAFASVTAAQSALATALRENVGLILLDVTMAAIAGVAAYAVLRLTELIRQLQTAHAVELSAERGRFDRDLHDLLGNRLSIIGLKGELARRLIDTDPARARAQLTEVIDVAHGAQSELRAVAHGAPAMSLAAELASARSALDAAGARCDVVVSCPPLSHPVTVALVAVIREGVANVLRHSLAQKCRIELDEYDGGVRLSIRNDGAIDRSPVPGRGLANLRERANMLGGHVRAGRTHSSWFELVAELPCSQGEIRERADHGIGGR